MGNYFFIVLASVLNGIVSKALGCVFVLVRAGDPIDDAMFSRKFSSNPSSIFVRMSAASEAEKYFFLAKFV